MIAFPSSLGRVLVIVTLLGGSELLHGSEPKRETRAFEMETIEDGIKVFTVPLGKDAGLAALLPASPRALPKVMSTSEFASIPEVSLEEPLPKAWTKREALEQLEFRFAKVNYFGLQRTDGFVQALLAHRADLAGLPFKMGMACRLSGARATEFATALGKVRNAERLPELADAPPQSMVAAMMQIHGPSEKQAELARKLATVPHVEATRALAKLALFSRPQPSEPGGV